MIVCVMLPPIATGELSPVTISRGGAETVEALKPSNSHSNHFGCSRSDRSDATTFTLRFVPNSLYDDFICTKSWYADVVVNWLYQIFNLANQSLSQFF